MGENNKAVKEGGVHKKRRGDEIESDRMSCRDLRGQTGGREGDCKRPIETLYLTVFPFCLPPPSHVSISLAPWLCWY